MTRAYIFKLSCWPFFKMKPKIGNIFVLINIFTISAAAEAVPRRFQRSNATCGVPKISKGLIVLGRSFSRGDFPWIVALMYSKVSPPTYFCAGTLVSSTFVLSGKKNGNELLINHWSLYFKPRIASMRKIRSKPSYPEMFLHFSVHMTWTIILNPGDIRSRPRR